MHFDFDKILNDWSVRAVLFDIDGTVLDSMGLWHEIDVRFCRKYRIDMPPDLQLQIAGMSMYETAVYFRQNFGLPQSEEDLMREWNGMALDAYLHTIRPKPGALEAMQYLKDREIRMGMATSNSRELTDAIFRANHFETYIDAVVTGGEVQNGKPAPDVYLKCAEFLQADPLHCLCFEDVLQGIRAGRAAQMKVIAVNDRWSRETLPEKQKEADLVIDGFPDLLPKDSLQQPE